MNKNNLTKSDLMILNQLHGQHKINANFNSTTIVRAAKNVGISERTAYRSINRLTKAGKLTTKTIYTLS